MENVPNPENELPGEAPEGAPKPGRTPPPITRLRTYQDDIAGAVRTDNVSAAKIFLAEEERRQRRQQAVEATSLETPRNKFFVGVSIFLVLAAIGGFVFFRFFYRAPAAEVTTVEVPLFIREDKVVEIPTSDRSYRDVQADLEKVTRTTVPSRQIYRIALSEARDASELGTGARQISSEKLFSAIGAYPPAELSRSLGNDFFIGVYSGVKGNLSFVILESVNPPLSRAAMLSWEETMAADLASIFPSAAAYAKNTAAQPGRPVLWEDEVYQNRDARVLSVNGQEILLWGFGDNGAIIIASDPFILPEMSSRLTRDRELH